MAIDGCGGEGERVWSVVGVVVVAVSGGGGDPTRIFPAEVCGEGREDS
jgi:hypothetical protein